MAKLGLDGLGDEIRDIVTEDVRATSLLLLTGLIKKTPVDTGRARGNWFLSIGSPIKKEDNSRRAPEATSEGITVSERIEPTDTAYITNNLPYIERLNEGHSEQAPAKFIEMEILRVTKRG